MLLKTILYAVAACMALLVFKHDSWNGKHFSGKASLHDAWQC